MRNVRSLQRVRWAVLPALSIVCFAPMPSAAPRVSLETRTRITIEFHPLTAALASDREAMFGKLVLVSPEPVETTLRLAWPDPKSVSVLDIRAAKAPAGEDSQHTVNLDARLLLPDRTTVHAARSVSFEDRGTVLFEVYRLGDRALTFALQLEATQETVVAAARAPGSKVRFRVEIVRVTEGRQVSLENNYLDTLVGEPVSYSFRLAETPEADAVSLTLEPTRIHAEVVEIDVEVSGRLPLDGQLTVIGRTERWLASRDAISTLSVESGEPPTGYRFLVTARF